MGKRHLGYLTAVAVAASSAGCMASPPHSGGENAMSATYANPIIFADYSDPDVIRSGDAYYLIASSFHMSPGLPILRSRDLVHWTIVSHVLPRLPDTPEYNLVGAIATTDANPNKTQGSRYGGGPWAPAIREHKGRFYVYWATPDEGIFMASAARPEGPWAAPVAVIPGPGFEDPCPFWDDDGTAWLAHSKVGAGPIILHRMSPDGRSVLDPGKVIVDDDRRLPVLEGPKVYKRNGWYYIFAPIGGVGSGPQAVGRSRKIYGPYEWRDVMLPGGSLGLKGPHQGGWVTAPDGKDWFLHFNQTGAFGRIIHLQPVRWENDWPIIGDGPAGQIAGYPVAQWQAPAPDARSLKDKLIDSDSFTSPKMGIQWEWNHNPDDQAWSLKARPGFLRLEALQASQLVTARNTLTQIMQGPAPIYTARLDVSAMADGQRAGLSMFNGRPSWVGAVLDQGRLKIVFSRAGTETIVGDVPSGTQWVRLRAEIAPDQTVAYSYSLNEGRKYLPASESFGLARYGWWKGTRPALFSFNVAGQGGRADFDWFDASQATNQPVAN